jgi:hypothetical protein
LKTSRINFILEFLRLNFTFWRHFALKKKLPARLFFGEIQSDCKIKILPIFLAANGNEKKRSGNFYFSDVWLLKTLKITSISLFFSFLISLFDEILAS